MHIQLHLDCIYLQQLFTMHSSASQKQLNSSSITGPDRGVDQDRYQSSTPGTDGRVHQSRYLSSTLPAQQTLATMEYAEKLNPLLENIQLLSYTISDRAKPYWMQAFFVVKCSGEKIKKKKNFSSQRHGREIFPEWCSQVDAEYSSKLNSGTIDDFKENVDPNIRNAPCPTAGTALNQEPSPKKQKTTSGLVLDLNIEPTCVIPSTISREVTVSHMSEIFSHSSGFENHYLNEQMSVSEFIETSNLLVEKLWFSIKSGNFFEVWTGHSLPLRDDTSSGLCISYETDFSKNQLQRCFVTVTS